MEGQVLLDDFWSRVSFRFTECHLTKSGRWRLSGDNVEPKLIDLDKDMTNMLGSHTSFRRTKFGEPLPIGGGVRLERRHHHTS